MTAPEPTVRPVGIRVEPRGRGRWIVVRGRFCLGSTGWEWEPSAPCDLKTAMQLAREAALLVTSNGPAVALADSPQLARRRGRPRSGGSARRGVPGESGQGPPQGAARGRGDVPGH